MQNDTDNKIKEINDSLAIGLGYKFIDLNILREALIHPSYRHEHTLIETKDNQRLEFLGDAILDMIIAELLYALDDNYAEGEMTKLRSSVACEESLARCAKDINLDEYLLLGEGENRHNGNSKPSILSDAFEALVAAVYLDSSYVKCRDVIKKIISTYVTLARKGRLSSDYKTTLLEYAQSLPGHPTASFELVNSEGPPHCRVFYIRARLGDMYAESSGKSKKQAEQLAARALLNML